VDPRLADDGLFLPTGLETFVSISRSHVTLLPSPYSDCISDLTPFSAYSTKLFNYFRNLSINQYSQSFCYKMCYQDNLINNCGCADATIPRIKNASYCLSDDELLCQKSVFNEFSTTDTKIYCKSSCPSQCDTLKYSLKLFNSNYPSSTYIQLLKARFRNASYESLDQYTKKSMLKVVVNYADLVLTKFDETPLMGVMDIFGMNYSLISFFFEYI
jgi:hypothetical protein